VTPTFSELGVPAALVASLARRGITRPFPVQAATIPDQLAGRDLCGRAPTGSGKTLAFGLPLIASVEAARPGAPHGLVLAPTRELAAQIRDGLTPLASAGGLRVLAVYGGVGYEPQRRALRRGIDVLVACPGRLADLLAQGALQLDSVVHVVVDEADRMADMGFLPQVRRLLDRTSPRRQTVLFSATLDGDVAELTRRYQRDPARHEIGSAEPDLHAMRHCFWDAAHAERTAIAADVAGTTGATIVFTRTRHGADRLARQLDRAGVRTAAIHGGRSQGQRDRALAAFATGHVTTLVATDVAARGIHVEGVACVLHFDPPADAKTYVHRSGRTARAGATGIVVSLVQPDQRRAVRAIQRELGLPPGSHAPRLAALHEPRRARTLVRRNR
jgi:superfamily II DNA/RNA helicase